MYFTYQARDLAGRICDGQVVADSADEAGRQLRQEGMYLLSLREGEAASGEDQLPAILRRRVRRGEMIYVYGQLAVMIDAGVPLAAALEGMVRQCENPTLASALSDIQRSVESGEPLSAAVAAFPKLFDPTAVNLIRASEASGTLPLILDRIATQSQAEQEMRQKVRGALMYPGAMLLMCISISAFLLVWVFPKLTPMFASRSLSLPGPTKLMMGLSESLRLGWYWWVLGIAAVLGLFLYSRRQQWGRLALDWCWLRLPVLGPMLQKVSLSRSLRTLATTVSAGVPVLESIELARGVSGNLYFERAWQNVAEHVTAGRPINEALEGHPLFPPSLVQMIAAGESTGKLGQVLGKVGDYFDREVASAIKAATSLIEPVMVFVMGGVIGTIALAMLLPIFRLSGHGG